MTISRRIWRGTAVVVGANIIARVGTFVANVMVVRLLGRHLVGELALIDSWLTLVSMFSLFGLGIAATRYLAAYLESDARMAGATAGVTLALGFLSSTVVTGIAYVILRTGLLGAALAPGRVLSTHAFLFSLLVLSTSAKSIAQSLAFGAEAFSSVLRINMGLGMVGLPILGSFTWWFGLRGVLEARLILATLEAALLLVVVRTVLARRGASLTLSGGMDRARELTAFAVPTLLSHVVQNPVQTFGMSFLSAQPGGVGQLGLLTTANRLSALAAFVPGSISSALSPILSSGWARDSKADFREGTESALRIYWLSALPVVALLVAASPTLLSVLYGQDFLAAWPLACGWLVLGLVANVNEAADRAFAAAGRQWLSALCTFAWAAAFAIGIWWFVPSGLAGGYILAYLLSFMPYFGLQMLLLHRLFGISLRRIRDGLLITIPLLGLSILSAAQLGWKEQLPAAALLALAALGLGGRALLEREERQLVSSRLANAYRCLLGRICPRQRSTPERRADGV